ncbi:hypothetical protein BH23BAC1_BH23BAC1_30210 [soil metagenome]
MNHKKNSRYTFSTNIFYFIILLLVSSCGGAPGLKRVLKKQTPYEKYQQRLQDSGLDETALGREWITSGQKALQDSLYITLPFSESGYFKAERPTASGYRFQARRGEVLVINVDVKTQQDTQLFIDLFEVEKITQKTNYLASGDTTNYYLEYEVVEDHDYLIRLQPELLRGGQYTITVITRPALAWPVYGEIKAIGSFFGADRDGGKRRHEGLDIFAAKGTPAIAAVEGRVTGVKENRLGGKVVWVTDMERRQSLYYAHLDTQMVRVGQKVFPGDTLGLVGNTGNARTTPPHLHFGIYRSGRGAVDPAPYVFQSSHKPLDIKVDAEQLGSWMRTTPKSSNLRMSPDTKSEILKLLPRHTPVMLTGGIDSWFRVFLPDGSSGYISSSLVETADKPIRQENPKDRKFVWDTPGPEAIPLADLNENEEIPVLAQFNDFLYVKSPEGILGWIPLIY